MVVEEKRKSTAGHKVKQKIGEFSLSQRSRLLTWSSPKEHILICEKYAARDSSKITLFAFQKVGQKGTVG